MTREESYVIETSTARIWLGGDGIVRFHYINAHVTLAEAQENIAAVAQVSGGQKRPLYNDARQILSLNREARVYYVSDDTTQVILAAGALLKTPVSKMLGALFLRLNRPPYPTRYFTDEPEAIDWLTTFLA